MAQGKKVLRCIRCGRPLQSNDPNEYGYISIDFLSKNTDILYCDSCYETVSTINSRTKSSDDDAAIVSYSKKFDKDKAVVLYVIDLFSFSGTIDDNVYEMIKDKYIVVIGTKKKLFGTSFNEKKMKDFILDCFAYYGLRLHNIFFFDKNEASLDSTHELFNAHFVDGHLNDRDVFIIGTKSSGKSALISGFLKNFNNLSNENISIKWLNRDLKATIIPLSNGKKFYEAPDLSVNSSVISKVEKPIQSLLIPKGTISSHSGFLKSNEGCIVGSIGGFIVLNGDSTFYKFYCAESVDIKKTSRSKFEDTFKNNMINKLVRPVSKVLTNLIDFEIFEFVFEKDNVQHEIGIEGLGFVTFKGIGQTIRVIVPKGVYASANIGRI